MGMNAAVELLGERLSGAESGLQWGIGMYIAAIGGLLALVSLSLAVVSWIMKKRKVDRSEKSVDKSYSGSSYQPPVFRKLDGKKEENTPPQFKKIERASPPGEYRQGISKPEDRKMNVPPPPPVDPFD
jgi:hypothetical protein